MKIVSKIVLVAGVAFLLTLGIHTWHVSDPGATAPPPRATNRLAGEASPYLQLHAGNPVAWQPWDDEAFERARREDKPIFLSIGYSTCYWCHVMEREVFSNDDIAQRMNESVVSIKVDREERPDIDALYMRATQLLTGSGGWPNSLFLTPAGEPFFAGTFFPATDRPGRSGFGTVIGRVAAAWRDRREDLESAARRVTDAVRSSESTAQENPTVSDTSLLERATKQLFERYDPEYGGFGGETKFPQPAWLELLLSAEGHDRGPHAGEMLTVTLDAMALGGVRDQLAGGFHRYSTEATWSVPHFEKMLYDNAQLLGLYSRALERTGSPLYRLVAEETADYLLGALRLPGGGFAAAVDAEVGGEEGATYLWRADEIRELLGEKGAAAFFGVYELVPVRAGAGALRVRWQRRELGATELVAELAEQQGARRHLLSRRQDRPQPRRDVKVVTAWNALAIEGLVDAARALERPDLLDAAENCARFLLGRLVAPDGSVRRSYIAATAREDGVLEDYAFLAAALLALHDATGDGAWGAHARRVEEAMRSTFTAPDGGFFQSPSSARLFARLRSVEDGALPSAPAVAARVLNRIAARSGDREVAAAGRRASAAVVPWLMSDPLVLASELAARLNGPPPSRRSEGPATHRDELAPLPRSADHVTVTAHWSDPSELRVRLAIGAGWHVQAHPASHSYLIATTVEVEGAAREAAYVTYPAGTPFSPDFAPDPIAVYGGTLEIPISLDPPYKKGVTVEVRYQACDDAMCLPPSRTHLSVPRNRGAGAESGPAPAQRKGPS